MAQTKLNNNPENRTTPQNLQSIIKSVRNKMRKDKGLNGDLDRIPMITWIMFLKFLDDQEKILEAEAKLNAIIYTPTIEFPYRWRDWAGKNNKITGSELMAFVNQDEAYRPDGTRGLGLIAYLRSLSGTKGKDRRDVIATVFKGVDNRMLSGYNLKDVIDGIDGIHFGSTEEIHTAAYIYESMLKEVRDAAGDSGEFYTPRPVIKFMVDMVDPKLGETVLDPAAGTGGFLVESFEHLKKQCKKSEDFELLQKKTLQGFEAKPMPFLLCQMNMLLHGIETPDIDPGNALRFKLGEIGDKDRVDIILTNPPFGAEEEAGIQGNFPPDKQTSETALLFLQLIMRKLKVPSGEKKGGRCGIVVPNGVLSNPGVTTRIREELLKEFNLHTIVRLPPGVFNPYTGVKTNLLFFEKGKPTKETWYFEHPLPPEYTTYTKTKPIRTEEFGLEKDWWNRRDEEKFSKYCWRVSIEDVKKRDYNLDIPNPNNLDETEKKSSNDIVELIEKLMAEDIAVLEKLKQELRWN